MTATLPADPRLLAGVRPEDLAAEAAGLATRGCRIFRLAASRLWLIDPRIAVRVELERVAAVRWGAGGGVLVRVEFEDPVSAAIAELALAALDGQGVEVVGLSHRAA